MVGLLWGSPRNDISTYSDNTAVWCNYGCLLLLEFCLSFVNHAAKQQGSLELNLTCCCSVGNGSKFRECSWGFASRKPLPGPGGGGASFCFPRQNVCGLFEFAYQAPANGHPSSNWTFAQIFKSSWPSRVCSNLLRCSTWRENRLSPAEKPGGAFGLRMAGRLCARSLRRRRGSRLSDPQREPQGAKQIAAVS